MVAIDEWRGLVTERNDDFNTLTVDAFDPAGSASGWSGAFRVVASDHRSYFVKSVDICPAGQGVSVASEMIIARIGRLIGAPVLETSIIRIPDELLGWEPRAGLPLACPLAHASVALEHADEQGRPHLSARTQDDNSRRHVGVYALYDWFFGHDAQWLYDIDADRTLYSHDHGLYIPPVGSGAIDAHQLEAMVDIPNVLAESPAGLSPAAANEIAGAIETVGRDTLATVLNSVPSCWGPDDQTLEVVGWFLEARAPAVAERLRALV